MSGRKFSERVEYTVGKGEMARYEQFLLFLQCFQKIFYCRHVENKGLLVWERVKQVHSNFIEFSELERNTIYQLKVVLIQICFKLREKDSEYS